MRGVILLHSAVAAVGAVAVGVGHGGGAAASVRPRVSSAAVRRQQGILGVDPDVRNGYEGIRVSYSIDADATRAELEAIVAQSQKRSAVFDIITNPTPVTVGLA